MQTTTATGPVTQTSLARELVPLHPNESSAQIGQMIYERMGRKGSLNAAKQAVYKERAALRKGKVVGKRGGAHPPAARAFPTANGASSLPYRSNSNESYSPEQLNLMHQIIKEYAGGPNGKTIQFTRAMREHPEWKTILLKGGRTMSAVYAKVAGVRRRLEKSQASQLPVPANAHHAPVEEIQTRTRRNPIAIAPALAIRHCPRCGKPIYLCHHCGTPETECRTCGESITAWSNIANVLQGLPR